MILEDNECTVNTLYTFYIVYLNTYLSKFVFHRAIILKHLDILLRDFLFTGIFYLKLIKSGLKYLFLVKN